MTERKGVGDSSSSRAYASVDSAATMSPLDAVKSLKNAPSTKGIVLTFTNDAWLAEAAKNASKPQVPFALRGDLARFDDATLQREIDAARARLAQNNGRNASLDDALIDRAEAELLRRRTPPMPAPRSFEKYSDVNDAIVRERAFLQRDGDHLTPQVRAERQAYLGALEARRDQLGMTQNACANARPTFVSGRDLPHGAHAEKFTADDLLAVLRTKTQLGPKDEQAVRDAFERWRQGQCVKTGADPTQLAEDKKYATARVDDSALAAESSKKILQMIDSMRSSPLAAAAFLDSVVRNETVDQAHARVRAAETIGDVAMMTPTAGKPTTLPQVAIGPAPKPRPKGPLVPPAPVTPKPAATTSAGRTTAVGGVEASAPKAFKTTRMNPLFAGEHMPGNRTWPGKTVRYLGPTERPAYKIEVKETVVNGRREKILVDAQGRPCDTRNATTHDGAPRAIFVMDANGDLYASNYQEPGAFHHSSLAAGQPVAAAGELVIENGRLIEITNRSGHYCPAPSYTEQALASLRAKGIDTSGVKIWDQQSKTERVGH